MQLHSKSWRRQGCYENIHVQDSSLFSIPAWLDGGVLIWGVLILASPRKSCSDAEASQEHNPMSMRRPSKVGH